MNIKLTKPVGILANTGKRSVLYTDAEFKATPDASRDGMVWIRVIRQGGLEHDVLLFSDEYEVIT